MASVEFSKILAFFKALSDESRLKIVGALASNDRSVEELATLLELRAPTVSHHLSKLKEVGLVEMRSEGIDSRLPFSYVGDACTDKSVC